MDSPIYLLPPAGTLLGSERLAASQAPFDGSHSAVYITLDSIVSYVSASIGGGNLTGSLNNTYLPIATGSHTLGNSRAHQTGTAFFIDSADGLSYLQVDNGATILRYVSGAVYTNFHVSSGNINLYHTDGTSSAGITVQGNGTQIYNDTAISLTTPSLYMFSQTADRVLVTDSSKRMVSSTITPTELLNVSGGTSNFQIQIDTLNSSLTTALIGLLNYRNTYTPSGGNYPSTGGSGPAGAIKKGNVYLISGLGAGVSAAVGGKTVSDGDLLISKVDTPGNTDSNWTIQEGNFGFTPLNASLTNGYVYIGNGSNIGTAVPFVPVTSGGTGKNTASPQSSIVFIGAAGVHTDDVTNLSFDNVYKTLNANNLLITPTAGLNGIEIQSPLSLGLSIISGKGGFDVENTSTLVPGGYIYSSGEGLKVDALDIAGKFSSEKQAGVFNQTGEATADTTQGVLEIYRDVNLVNIDNPIDPISHLPVPFVAQGPMLDIHDNTNNYTSASGASILIRKQFVQTFTISKEGYVGIGNVAPDSAIVMDGTVDQTIKIAYNPTSASPGKILNIISGNATIGSTNQAAGNLILSTGTSRGTGVGNVLIYSTPAGSTGNSENSATPVAIFKGDKRIGLNGITLPAAYLTMQAPDGAYAFNILNKDLTTSNGYDTGWGWRPATNSTSSNLIMYELSASTFQNRHTFHKGGNVTIGSDTGNGDALLHVKGGVFKVSDGTIERFNVASTGQTYYNLKTNIKVSVAGGLSYSVAQTNNSNTSPTDIYSYTIKADTLKNSGDTFVAEYGFILSTATHTKQFTVSFNGTAIYTGSAFSLTNATGSGKIVVTVIMANSAFIEYTVQAIMSDGTALTPVLHQVYSFYTSSVDCTTDQIIKVTATCGVGSTTGEVVGNGAKYFLNPQF